MNKHLDSRGRGTAHYHVFDLHPTYPTMVACSICGFSAPAICLKSKTSLDAYTARMRCSQAVLDLLSIDRHGNPVSEV